jgi:hypothetical protein
MLKTVSSITNAIGALNYKGTWNASTNSPALASGVGTKGDYYVVSVAGSTNLDGETLWGVGDWAVYNGAAWQKVEGGNTINATTVSASTSVTTPVIQATSSAGGTLKNNGGTAQLQWGSGGGSNLSLEVATNINPANAAVAISPTGTGTVTINPATASTMNNVAIGGTTPLAITGTAITATGVATFSAGTAAAPAITTTGDTNTGIFFPAADTIAVSAGGTESMRSDGGGGGNLYVASGGSLPSTTVSGVALRNANNTGPSISSVGSATGGGQQHWSFINGNGQQGFIATYASGTAYVTSSDYRLKENIAPMIGALDVVAKLKPVTYTWKSDGSDGQGFIAHELQEVVPDCVVGKKDAVNEDGSIKVQAIDTSFLVATLVAAIQEQQAIIEQLKQKVGL